MPRKLTTTALSAGFLLLLMAGPAPDAGAQTSPPPTVPCPGCGPSGTKLPGNSGRAWSYPEHRCVVMNGVNRSNFNLVFGLSNGYPNPVSFQATVDDVATATPLVTVPLGTLTAGQQRTTGTIVTVPPNVTITMKVTARDTVTGAVVQFGDGTLVKTSQLTCDCVQPNTTTTSSVPATSSPPSSVPSTPGTTVPGTPTTTPSLPVVPGTPTTAVLSELPATGTTTRNVGIAGGFALVIGAVMVYAAIRRPEHDDA